MTRLAGSVLSVGRRDGLVLATAAVVGMIVGLVILGFELLVEDIIHRVESERLAIVAIAPAVGLIITALSLRFVGGRTTASTSDEYIRVFHDRVPRLALRPWIGRLIGGVATVGSGGALGLEGPAIYTGATIGVAVPRWLRRFNHEETRLLLSAGAAAGISAIFKTPATGVVFALEAPYTDDVGRRALLPALVASAAGYSTFVSAFEVIRPNNAGELRDLLVPPLTFNGLNPQLATREIVGAILLGLLAGLSAWLFAGAVNWVKALADRPLLPRLVVGAATLGGLALLSEAVYDKPLSSGPGIAAAEWATDPAFERTVGFLALLLGIRVVATLATVGAGGAGGMFIPLAVQGILLGQLVGTLIGQSSAELFPIIGEAAFLGAGYRTPLASVMFVAETTASSNYVIPALIAAAVSQLIRGRSVSRYQRDNRLGHLERRFALPIATVLSTDTLTVPPDATAAELVDFHLIGRREREVPVVDGEHYLGMCGINQVSDIPRDEWEHVTVGEIMDTNAVAGRPSWALRQAVVAMEQTDAGVLPVTDSEGIFVGVVDEAQILKLDKILDETGS